MNEGLGICVGVVQAARSGGRVWFGYQCGGVKYQLVSQLLIYPAPSGGKGANFFTGFLRRISSSSSESSSSYWPAVRCSSSSLRTHRTMVSRLRACQTGTDPR